MAQNFETKKMSEFTQVATVNDSDQFLIIQNGSTVRTTIGAVKNAVGNAGGNNNVPQGGSNGVDFDKVTEATAVNEGDFVLINQNGTSYKIAAKEITKIVPTGVTQIGSAQEDDLIPVYRGGSDFRVIPASALGGGGGAQASEFIELIGDDGATYRGKVVNGQFVIYPAEVDTAEPVTASRTSVTNYGGLMINKVFAGGADTTANDTTTSCSHNFIELYNLKTDKHNKDVNLNGVYLFYKPSGGAWKKIALKGILKANHSFLIRGAQCGDRSKAVTRLKIDNYDLSVPDLKLTHEGFTLVLYFGEEDIDEGKLVRNTKDPASGAETWFNERYIDVLGVGGVGETQNPPFSEKGTRTGSAVTHRNIMSKTTGIMREDFANSGAVTIGSNKKASEKGNNYSDTLPVDYSSCDLSKFRPRTSAEGEWSVFVDKPGMKNNCPNLVTICYGEDGNTARTFTWQSAISDEGWLKYRKNGDTDWISVESERQIISNQDGESMIHRVIVHGLEVGVYEYMAGEEGGWSDVSTFEVKDHKDTKNIKIIWTTDEQGWTANEYNAVKSAADFIRHNEDYDFHLNTGDISQNANRVFEWRYYYKYYPDNRNICHMMTCGNNDLIDKKHSDAFNYYSTHENKWSNSAHGWDLGNTHFVCINSNEDSTYVDGVGSIGGYADIHKYLQAQCAWLDEHLTQVKSREVTPRWIVCYMHLAPFTVERQIRLQRFIEVFEKHEVDLVLCGHNHCFSRSKALKTGYVYGSDSDKGGAPYNTYVKGTAGVTTVDELKPDGSEIDREHNPEHGTYYIMCQATGYKLSGKQKPLSLNTTIDTTTDAALAGTKHVNSDGSPWWVAAQGTPSQPTYGVIEITDEHIKVDIKYIKDILRKDQGGDIQVLPFTTEGPNAQTSEQYDTITINHAKRH